MFPPEGIVVTDPLKAEDGAKGQGHFVASPRVIAAGTTIARANVSLTFTRERRRRA
jgi:hypothetical protein